MAIGKVLQRYWNGSNQDRYQTVYIVLLPSFPESRYKELEVGKQYATTIGSGTTLYAESGSQLQVTGVPGYPNIVADSLEKGVSVYGKITNDDKEALGWIKRVADRLFPNRLLTSQSKWESTWKPLREAIDSADSASRAADVLSKIRAISEKRDVELVEVTTSSGPGNPGTIEVGKSSSFPDSASGDNARGQRHKEELSAIKDSGKQAIKEAGTQIRNEVSDWWDDLGGGWKIGLIGLGGVLIIGTAMSISEKVK